MARWTIPAATVACLIGAGAGHAATFDITLLQTSTTQGQPPILNVNDAPVLGGGSLTIADSAIAPNAFVAFGSGNITDFVISYVDNLGVTLSFEIPGDIIDVSGDNDAGVLFDTTGAIERFDIPQLFRASPGIELEDDEILPPGVFTENPVLAIQDFDDLNTSILLEDVTQFARDRMAGDFVNTDVFGDFMLQPIANTFRAESSQKENLASGFVLLAPATVTPPMPPAPNPVPAPIPVPASGLLFLGSLVALLGYRKLV